MIVRFLIQRLRPSETKNLLKNVVRRQTGFCKGVHRASFSREGNYRQLQLTKCFLSV